MLKGLAFTYKISEEWFVSVRDELDKIASLQSRRNRLVHDVWVSAPGGGAARWRKMVQFKKAQSFKPEELVLQETVPVDIEEIWDLTQEVTTVTGRISMLSFQLIEVQLKAQPQA